MNINKRYLQLKDDYLFADIAQRASEYKARNPGAEIISLGVGDVTLPLVPAIVDAMQSAVAEMGDKDAFRGYGDYQGYEFLRRAISGYYAKKGVELGVDEIFVSDGAKSDLGNILDIFSQENTVLIPDPVYPAYVDTNIMAGHKIIYMDANIENEFLPLPDDGTKADIIYLCSPNNPTGAVYDRRRLKLWVDYALAQDAVILFDGAYEAFVRDRALPASIYEIEGARRCAIEFCSLSKTAGFTGVRCGYTVVPRELRRAGASLNSLWLRRQTTKYNGVPYIVQRGAEAVFSAEGWGQLKACIDYYLENARMIARTLQALDIWFAGGVNSPYIWLRCPKGMTSWDYFDTLLTRASVVGTPGVGFGKNGEGFFRLTAFGDRDKTKTAMERIAELHAL